MMSQIDPGAPVHLSRTVVVRPIYGGWCVESPFVKQSLVFYSGRDAEASARRLALTLANCGADANLIIHDRQNARIGTVYYMGQEPPDA